MRRKWKQIVSDLKNKLRRVPQNVPSYGPPPKKKKKKTHTHTHKTRLTRIDLNVNVHEIRHCLKAQQSTLRRLTAAVVGLPLVVPVEGFLQAHQVRVLAAQVAFGAKYTPAVGGQLPE